MVSLWGGREHFIIARVERSSDICMYFEWCACASAGAGDEGSGVGESDDVVVVDGEGESSRERLGIACANVAVRRLLWLFLSPHTTPHDGILLSHKGFDALL